ncbi:MAG: aminomethyl-transferring glycine dehydrogenase subunit GcvPA [Deltaproteobacteria bacterium]|nr:aminomethyl-transferring glycine dehydrogenase subunit GcvPA [Deltaproteobacteria bacterium]
MRYIPHSDADVQAMLETIGAKSVDELFAQIPERLRFGRKLDLPRPLSEPELMAHLEALAGAAPAGGRTSFLGGGAYCHHVSPVVDQILLRSEFYTAYTPYQPEVSQGTLQAVFEFQTMVARLLGMATANASMYDGATAAAEAALMARRVTGRDRVLVSAGVHPEYRDVIRTFLTGLDGGTPKLDVVPVDDRTGAMDLAALDNTLGPDVAAILAGYPGFYGVVEPLHEVVKRAAAAGALAVSVTAEPFALGVLCAPGDLGADIAVAEGQALGVPISFGGPGVGLFACRDDKKLLRQMPGRLVGQTTDANGNTGYVLTLSTREQHIRREKATSNICSNQGLCALAVTIRLSLLGKTGFEAVARSCLARAEYLKKAIAAVKGLSLRYSGPTFNEFAVRVAGRKASAVLAALEDKGFLGGIDLGRFDPKMDDTFLVAVTECIDRARLDAFVAALKKV